MNKFLLIALLCLCGCVSSDNIEEDQETTTSYDDSEYLYLDYEYESWSSILLSKSGDSFFVQSEEGVAKNIIYIDPETQQSVYIEFDDEQYPSLMVVDDVSFIFSNYRDNLVDIALVNGDKQIYTYYDVECNLSGFDPATKASVLTSAYGIANIVFSVSTIAEAVGLGVIAVGSVATVGVPVTVIATLSCLIVAGATACSMIVDSYDIWVAPSSDDLSSISTVISLATIKNKSDVAMLALGYVTSFLDDMTDTIKTARDELAASTENDVEYIIDIAVSEIISSDETSATCELQGTLEAEANDGEFNFNYGICYSTNSTPTVNDQTVFSSCVSSDFLSLISLSLPISMTMVNLETETTYYYRAYFQDNITGEVSYGNEIKEFTLSPESDERAILEQIYYATGGDNWTNNTNWCTDAPLSEWYGVYVDSQTGKVRYLNLSDNNLTGDCVFNNLLQIKYIDICNNKINSLNISNCGNDVDGVSVFLNGVTASNVIIEDSAIDYVYAHTNINIEQFTINNCNIYSYIYLSQHPSYEGSSMINSLSILNCEYIENGSRSMSVGFYIYTDYTLIDKLDIQNCIGVDYIYSSDCNITVINLENITFGSSTDDYYYGNTICLSNNNIEIIDITTCYSVILCLSINNNKLNGDITQIFNDYTPLSYDKKYNYYTEWNSSTREYETKYTENEYGLWYSGEPDKGGHYK
ncbi:MAG: hypothetical protein R3Y26_01605 [Rikenellaceae bacterium]